MLRGEGEKEIAEELPGCPLGVMVTMVLIDQETENRLSGGSVAGAGRVGLGQSELMEPAGTCGYR